MNATVIPEIVPQAEWLAARLALLEEEKALTKRQDEVNAKRRRLPMVRLDKAYFFDTTEGEKSLLDLFEGHHQLIVYHFMFDPAWDEGCMGCTGFVDAIGDLSMLGERDTSFALVSRAPLAKLLDYRAKRGWERPWVSSFGNDFNVDFGVTLEGDGPKEFNYKPTDLSSEMPGLSVFFRDGENVFHTYSTYARGVEYLTDSYRLLDVTPYGRQEDFEDSPEGWPQRPTYG